MNNKKAQFPQVKLCSCKQVIAYCTVIMLRYTILWSSVVVIFLAKIRFFGIGGTTDDIESLMVSGRLLALICKLHFILFCCLLFVIAKHYGQNKKMK